MLGAWEFMPRDVAWWSRFFYGVFGGLTFRKLEQGTHGTDIRRHQNRKTMLRVSVRPSRFRTDRCSIREQARILSSALDGSYRVILAP